MAKVGERVRNPHLKDEYYVASIVEMDGCKCTVYRPILTEHQRKLREEAVKDALAEIGRKLFELGEFEYLQDGFTEVDNGNQQEPIAG